MNDSHHYRAIWLADVHLGARGCQAAALLSFLEKSTSEFLYLAGDIFDGPALRAAWQWTPLYNELLQTVLRKAGEGTRVIYTPGERDAGVYRLSGRRLGRIAMQPHATHTTADGRQLLVLHGDAFDGAMRYALWTDLLGAWSRPCAVHLDRWR